MSNGFVADSNNIASDVPFVILNIISTKLSFQLQVSQGSESSTFVAEIFRSVEGNKYYTIVLNIYKTVHF